MKILFFLIGLFSALNVEARLLKGNVRDKQTGEAIIGACIAEKNRPTNKVISDDEGNFQIDIQQSGRTLVCSYLGYETQELNIKDLSEVINIQMCCSNTLLGEITVVGENHGRTESGAISIEKNSPNIVNVISSKSIEQSPDLTVANVIQRMSGITIERGNTGEGQYAILRGMDKRYNYTLVNGVKIPSPDNKNRFVPLDIFPSELLDRLVVSKSLTADQEGDGIGGAVNLVMKDAPEKRMINANLSIGYSSLFMDRDFISFNYRDIARQSPNEIHGINHSVTMSDFTTSNLKTDHHRPMPDIIGGLSYGDRFLDKRLGVILAASFQNCFRGKESDVHYQPGNTYTGVTDRTYDEQQRRIGAHAKLDYRFNPLHKLSWYNGYIDMSTAQVRDEVNPQWETVRLRWNHQYIFNSTLKGEHRMFERDALKTQWAAVLSKAYNETPDNAEINLTTTKSGVQTVSVNPAATRRWEHNSDLDKAGYLDFSYNLALRHSSSLDISWGAMFRDKDRKSYFNEYTFKLPSTDRTQVRGEDWNDFNEIVFQPNKYGNLSDPLNYDADEQIGAAYAMFKFMTDRLEIIGGLRMEHTRQGYELKYPTEGARNKGAQKYYDFLPDLHFKYTVHNNAHLRMSYGRSINRPSFFEIVPYNILNEDYKERGNPDLKHTIADNLDVRYEYFPHPNEQFMVGLFYKNIKNPIEYGLKTSGQDVYYMPDNFGTASNYGVELDVTKYFFKHFGIKANYTYTHSKIKTDKTLLIDNPDPDAETNTVTTTVKQARPLFGQAAHVANLSLLYSDKEKGWNLQLASGYTGDRLVSISRYYNHDIWEDGYIHLDLSAEKAFTNGLCLFLKANNLLNTPLVRYVPQNKMTEGLDSEIERYKGNILERKEHHGQSITIGVRYKL